MHCFRQYYFRGMGSVSLLCLLACGGGAPTGSTKSSPPPAVPAQVTGLSATGGMNQVSLSWTAVSGATGYIVLRSTSSTGSFMQIATPTATTYTDTSVTGGTTYYYEVEAVNANGTGPASNAASAMPMAATTAQSVQVTVNALENRHSISPLIYGMNLPSLASDLTAVNATLARWGGDASTRYNWTNHFENSANDWYFSNGTFNALSTSGMDSVQFSKDIVQVGADVVTTIPMNIATGTCAGGASCGWVAKDGTSYSFSVRKYGAQCKSNPYNSDAGNGIEASDCKTPITGNDPTDANVELLDAPRGSDPAGSVYRSQWVQALAAAFGSSPHFYQMDNEPGIWNGTHRDVHPNPVTYSELADDFLSTAGVVQSNDAQAVILGPISCCWEEYWNSTAGASDKQAHGNLDYWPWWLNHIYWTDQVNGTQTLKVFDFHAYPELSSPSTPSATFDAQVLRATQGWWNTSYVSEAWIGTVDVTSMQPKGTVEARLLRARAIVDSIYPSVPVGLSEWNFALSNTDLVPAALTDADAWGLLGVYNFYEAAHWPNTYAPNGSSLSFPSYQILKLYRNFDGNDGSFGSISVYATNNANPGLFSSFAAVDPNGKRMTLMLVNKNPSTTVNATLDLMNFQASSAVTYTVQGANGSITSLSPIAVTTASPSQIMLPPYSATMVVLTGQLTTAPTAEWNLNPDIVMVSAGTTITLQPSITSGTGTVTLSNFTAPNGGITGTIQQSAVASTQMGAVQITAGGTPGFYPFSIEGTDNGGAQQTQNGWIEVGNPAASLNMSGNNQSGAAGSALNLSVTLDPGSSAATTSGMDILFTITSTGGGSLSQRLVQTNSSGVASTTLTLPSSAGTVTVTAEAPYPVGHPMVTFTETAQ
jgi:hypothetical protein